MAVIELFSFNTHDKSLEAAMPAPFLIARLMELRLFLFQGMECVVAVLANLFIRLLSSDLALCAPCIMTTNPWRATVSISAGEACHAIPLFYISLSLMFSIISSLASGERNLLLRGVQEDSLTRQVVLQVAGIYFEPGGRYAGAEHGC
jgi:hypothetical protein